MRIVVKILLSFGTLIIGVVLFALMSESGGGDEPVVRLIPAIILIGGIIGIWRYKPDRNKTSDTTDLDKTL